MFKILALDGGGIRSIFQARIISRLEERLGRSLLPSLIAGTSGGAIIGCALTKFSPEEVMEFYRKKVGAVFKKGSFLDDIEDVWNLAGAKYANLALKNGLKSAFGDETLGSIQQKILITSFSLQHPDGNWQPVVFHNFPSAKASSDLTIVDALMRSTAAPTYFPVYQKHTDGGVWGNNPSMSALAATLDQMVGRQRVDRISLLSIGAGILPSRLKGSKNDLGSVDWLQKGLIDLLLDGNVEASHYYTRSILGPAYYRVQINLDREIKLDDASNMETMVNLANGVDLEPILEWMQGFWSI